MASSSSTMGIWIKYLFFAVLFVGVGFYFGRNSLMDTGPSYPGEDEIKAEILLSQMSHEDHLRAMAEIERHRPMEFLRLEDISSHSGLFSSNVTIDCTVNNSAFRTDYKDLEFEVNCMSKTNSVIEQSRHKVYEIATAHTRSKLSFKFRPPDDTESYNVRITAAVPSN